ncbi:MAG: hypothetical protein IJC19_03175 [Clostridia bacterium]|nr:hypothetical protein [Clostridia bacterium]
MNLGAVFPSKGSLSSAKKSTDPVKLSLFFRKYRFWFILGFFVLILLFLLVDPQQESAEKPKDSSDLYVYSTSLKRELETTLSQMQGVGRCTVLITFVDSGEWIYACDEDGSTSESGKITESKKYVLISSRSDGLVLKVYTPAVRGIAVICEGGDSARVKSDVTEVLSGTLGITADRISVKKRTVQE